MPIWKASDQHVLTDRLLRRRPVRAHRQQLHADVPGSRAGGHPAAVRHRVGLLGPFVQRVGLPAADAEHRRHDQLLPAERRSAATTRSRSATAGARRSGGRSATPAATRCPASRTRRRRARTFGDGCNADLFRDGFTEFDLKTHAIYVQDTYTVKRLTFNLGVRWDRQTDAALAADVRGQPDHPADHAGDQLPRPRLRASSGTTSRRGWA